MMPLVIVCRSITFGPRAVVFYTSHRRTTNNTTFHNTTLAGTMSEHASWVLSVACHPDGTQLATGSSDKTVKVWDLRTRKSLHTSTSHQASVWSVCYNRTGTRIASVSDAKELHITEVPP